MDSITQLEKKQPGVQPKTPQMEALLASGYNMTVEEARAIVKERDKEPERWPYAEYKKAKAMLAAYESKPQVISKRQPWRIRGHSRVVRG